MSRLVVGTTLALLITASPLSADARMTPDVFRARAWLQQRMDDRHFACLHRLWSAESGWRVHSLGPMTRWGRAMGIPQALPGSKMRTAGRDWRTSALTQVRWGLLHYIRPRYNGACAALRHFGRFSWY